METLALGRRLLKRALTLYQNEQRRSEDELQRLLSLIGSGALNALLQRIGAGEQLAVPAARWLFASASARFRAPEPLLLPVPVAATIPRRIAS